jgi:hypothetical protein
VLERLGQTREKIPVAPVTVAARYTRPKKWMNHCPGELVFAGALIADR